MVFEIFQSERRADHHYVAARFWFKPRDHAAGRPADLVNDFRLRLPVRHQRIRRGPRGGLLHLSGEVLPAEWPEFAATADPWQRNEFGWIHRDDRGRWIRRDGLAVPPFRLGQAVFDPQWQRERFRVPLAAHIDRELRAYAERARIHEWSGDCRGTTSVYQVGASGDDGAVDSTEVFDAVATNLLIGESPGYALTHNAWYRFTGVSGVGGRTIASAHLSLWGYATDVGDPATNVLFAADASPTAPASYADYWVRARTAAVAWNSPGLSTSGWTDSPNLKTILQEVADAYTPTTLLVFHQNNGSTDATTNPWAYDGDTSRAAKLTIDNGEMFRPFRRRPIYER